jgi:hypothetical protein
MKRGHHRGSLLHTPDLDDSRLTVNPRWRHELVEPVHAFGIVDVQAAIN